MKTYLLDTCVLLWAVREPKRLSRQAARILESGARLLLSPASAWEITVKADKLKLPTRPGDWISLHRKQLMLEWLPLYGDHVLMLDSLPQIHHDPFDRILVCQAISESITLITPDETIRQYPATTLW